MSIHQQVPLAQDVVPPPTNIEDFARLHGVDPSGLGEKGWAEVPPDNIGGHPELEPARPTGPRGGLNGLQPVIDPATGLPIPREE